jgi:hypothetical protein
MAHKRAVLPMMMMLIPKMKFILKNIFFYPEYSTAVSNNHLKCKFVSKLPGCPPILETNS